MIQLKLYTYDQWGNEIATPWSFTPLTGEDQYDVYRESTTSASGTIRRRPISEKEICLITLGAGLLLIPAHWANFRRMLRAHKILWYRAVGSPTKFRWLEYKLDEEKIALERLEESQRLRRIQITLEEAIGIDFTQFEQPRAQHADSLLDFLP